MHTTIDAAGRIVVPKALRDALGLTPGTALDVSTDASAPPSSWWHRPGHTVAGQARTATADQANK